MPLHSTVGESIPDEDPIATSYIATHTCSNINTFKTKQCTDITSTTRQIDVAIDNTVLSVANKIATKKELEMKIYTLHLSLQQVEETRNQLMAKNARLSEGLKELKSTKQAVVKAGSEVRESIGLQQSFANTRIDEINLKVQESEALLNALTLSKVTTAQLITSNKACFENLMGKLKDEQIAMIRKFSDSTNEAKDKMRILHEYSKAERTRSKSINNKSKLLTQLIKQEQVRNVNNQIGQSASKIIKSPDKLEIKSHKFSSTPMNHK
jgi:hypothetical protein